jgi:hypothetical protein
VRIAFKEWAIVVDALGRGEQIIILRKGGISEGRGGFKPEQPRFLLFPTAFHQQRESVIESAQKRYDEIAASLPGKAEVQIEYWAEVILALDLKSYDTAAALRGQHIWREEVIAARFEWGRDKGIHALGVRVHRLRHPARLPLVDKYGGCKSWIELEHELETVDSTPVLSEAEFARRTNEFRAALQTPLSMR